MDESEYAWIRNKFIEDLSLRELEELAKELGRDIVYAEENNVSDKIINQLVYQAEHVEHAILDFPYR